MKHIVAALGIIAACFVGCGGKNLSSGDTPSEDGKGGQGTGGSAGQYTGGSAGVGGYGGTSLADTCELELLAWGEFGSAVSSRSKLEGPAITATQEAFVVHYGDATPDPDQSRVVNWKVDFNAKASHSSFAMTSCPDNTKYQWTGFAALFDFLANFKQHGTETPTGVLITLGACDEDNGTVNYNTVMSYVQFDGNGVYDVQSYLRYDLGRANIMSTARTKSFALDDENGDFYLAVQEENKPRPLIFRFRNGLLVTDTSGQIEGHPSQVDEFQVATGFGRIPQLARTKDGLLYKMSSIPGGELIPIEITKGSEVLASSLATNLSNNKVLIAYVGAGGVKWLLDNGHVNFSRSGNVTTSFSQPKSVDVARANNGFIVAVGGNKNIHVYRTFDLELDEPSTKWKDVALGEELAKLGGKATGALANFDGQRMEVATNDKHVLVSWLNKLEPNSTATSVGGYALMFCGGEKKEFY